MPKARYASFQFETNMVSYLPFILMPIVTWDVYSCIHLCIASLSSSLVQVWASKWNERAYFSTRKVKLDHDYLCMAVLVQEIISADYAFVIHTTNPSTGDSSEIYAEVCLPRLLCRHWFHFSPRINLFSIM